MCESVFNFFVPVNYLHFLIQLESARVEAIRAEESEVWSTQHGISRRSQISYHLSLISAYRAQLRFLDTYKGPGFRASTLKKDENYQFLPINCHLQEIVVETLSKKGKPFSFSSSFFFL